MKNPIYKTPVARSIPFDNSTNGFESTDVQSAIEEIKSLATSSATPGFSWGRSGVVPPGTYLQNDTVPSNTSGRTVFLSNAQVKGIFVTNEDPTVLQIEIVAHDGSGANLSILGSVTTLANKSNLFAVNFPVQKNKQLGIRLKSTSNSAKNIVVGLLLDGKNV